MRTKAMSRARHKKEHEHKRAKGGGVKPVWNAGGEQNAAKEAEERKRGGRVHVEGEGEHPKHRSDRAKRARGGSVPGRKRGGGVGADKMPLSSAAKIKQLPGELSEEGEPSD
jgi:hypothetical protein